MQVQGNTVFFTKPNQIPGLETMKAACQATPGRWYTGLKAFICKTDVKNNPRFCYLLKQILRDKEKCLKKIGSLLGGLED